MSEPQTYSEAIKELRLILLGCNAPVEVLDSALRVVKRVNECLRVVPQCGPTSGTGAPSVRLEPSDFFLRYIAAARALDWPEVLVLEHDDLRRRGVKV